MRISEISVRNYRSLHEVTVRPRALNVLVGPNDSGKSNFADFLDFLADVYQHDLETAVTRKGGIENVAFQDGHRLSTEVAFSVAVDLPYPSLMDEQNNKEVTLHYRHDVRLKLPNLAIRGMYSVAWEQFTITKGTDSLPFFTIERVGDAIRHSVSQGPWPAAEFELVSFLLDTFRRARLVGVNDLMITILATVIPIVRQFPSNMSQLRVFQVSPSTARQPGAPVPNPQLDRFGANLPSVVDHLQRKHPLAWGKVLVSMRRIKPDLRKIEVEYTDSRLLGLFFREEGYERAWTAVEVSDGTIQALAVLTAIFDPESSFLVLEEPENSVHPWIIRNIVEACRSVSRRKQILLTTHSPILIDSVKPSEVLVIWRNGKGSHLQRLEEIEPNVERSWRDGSFSISEFLDTGAVLSYVPAGVRPSTDEEDDRARAEAV